MSVNDGLSDRIQRNEKGNKIRFHQGNKLVRHVRIYRLESGIIVYIISIILSLKCVPKTVCRRKEK